MQSLGRRIVVMGVTGSGKSTLARTLAEIYDLGYIELDALFWKSNWVQSSDEEFFAKITRALKANPDGWVVDGNYTRSNHLIWSQSDSFIWLDYPLRVNFWRLWKRSWKRFLTRENLWETNNRENLWKHFFTRDSLFLWAIQSHPRKRKQYSEAFQSSDFASHCLFHFSSPLETNQWLKSLKNDKH